MNCYIFGYPVTDRINILSQFISKHSQTILIRVETLKTINTFDLLFSLDRLKLWIGITGSQASVLQNFTEH